MINHAKVPFHKHIDGQVTNLVPLKIIPEQCHHHTTNAWDQIQQ